ncbi:exodeoxyribonuclease V subunit gamma [Alteromonadaceae bacterium BrNp21-10]|nr:exodeoxyribonuclease V subunit gamma [Alteromonadaceae bacterium BrNp21-10]
MLTVYPSNKLEHHVDVLLILLKAMRQSPLQPVTIVVENKAMQHWLQMEIARRQGIAMQFEFIMPSGFIWQVAREVLPNVPRETSYSRDVLRWRIDQLLISDEFAQHELAVNANIASYWSKNAATSALMRFQMAAELADLFEQYLMFRPLQLQQWSEQPADCWQALLWKLLVKQQPQHPLALQQQLLTHLQTADMASLPVPDNLLMFAINHMPPQTLSFFKALSSKLDIHLFHLNPCGEYWGNVLSDKTKSRQQLSLLDEEDFSNPLLANLGQQGKDFFNRLLEGSFNEINLQCDPIAEVADPTVLQQIQQDIFALEDRREQPQTQIDNSIHLVSCHSALREVQVLHDWLLHQFEQDPDLTPRDVLILCPGVEDYAPYVLSVFRHPYASPNQLSPQLPCSVADRAPLDAEPLVAAFMDLLDLPDSRFAVSKIISYLKLPAIAQRFGIEEQDVDTLSQWLLDACVHWGVDAQHVEHFIERHVTVNDIDVDEDGDVSTEANTAQNNDGRFTWQWGLQRLLLGFMRADHAHIALVNQQPMHLLPTVEGGAAVLLGRLMQLLESLQQAQTQLKRARSAEQWQSFLLELKEQLFTPSDDNDIADNIITQVIADIRKQLAMAHCEQVIPLAVMRHALRKRFTLADNYNQFLTGAVTFSSMVPMRSIPFKVVAIVGLNDGQFPRQSQPNSFDVLQLGSASGDRSRRNDDRYLFLESLLSARQKLYLSYVGHDIKNNNEKQPSLVLQELLDYLRLGFNWPLTASSEQQHAGSIVQQPLHPFSPANFKGDNRYRSFDNGWKNLALAALQGRSHDSLSITSAMPWPDAPMDIEELVSLLSNPLKFFANQQMRLWLKQQQTGLEDNEPFELDPLLAYNVKSHLLTEQLGLNDESPDGQQSEFDYIQQQTLAGQLPREEFSQDSLEKLAEDIGKLSEKLQPLRESAQAKLLSIVIDVAADVKVTLEANIYWQERENQVLSWRPASRNAKDEIRLWLQHLMATAVFEQPVSSTGLFIKPVGPLQFSALADANLAREHLQRLLQVWQQASQQPLLVHAELAKTLMTKDADIQAQSLEELQGLWDKRFNDINSPLDRDGYLDWFYPQQPELTPAILQKLQVIYQPMYQHIVAKAAGKARK